jgi:HSP20 family protein
MSNPTRYQPLRETFNFQRNCNQTLEEGVASGHTDRSGWLQPAVDLRETEDAFILELTIPGFSPDDIHISITGNLLSICGEVLAEDLVDEDSTYHLRERQMRSFQRSFTLPHAILIEGSEALFSNGELKLRLPKVPEQSPQMIEVRHA